MKVSPLHSSHCYHSVPKLHCFGHALVAACCSLRERIVPGEEVLRTVCAQSYPTAGSPSCAGREQHAFSLELYS